MKKLLFIGALAAFMFVSCCEPKTGTATKECATEECTKDADNKKKADCKTICAKECTNAECKEGGKCVCPEGCKKSKEACAEKCTNAACVDAGKCTYTKDCSKKKSEECKKEAK